MEANMEGRDMKKKIGIIVGVLLAGSLVSCGNQTFFDTTYTFNYAEIKLPSGEIIKGEVDSWTDYEDGEQLQIKMKKDGNTYLVNSNNVVLSVDPINYDLE